MLAQLQGQLLQQQVLPQLQGQLLQQQVLAQLQEQLLKQQVLAQLQVQLLQQLPEVYHSADDQHCCLPRLCSAGPQNQTPWTRPLAGPLPLAWALPGALQHLQAQHALHCCPDDQSEECQLYQRS